VIRFQPSQLTRSPESQVPAPDEQITCFQGQIGKFQSFLLGGIAKFNAVPAVDIKTE
jgi:hypothetical protein